MPATSTQNPTFDERQTFALAATVLAEMRRYGLPPIPSYYEIWYHYRTGDSTITERIGRLLAEKRFVDRTDLDQLRIELGAVGETAEKASDVAEELREAADTLIEQVSDNQAAARLYGEALSRGAQHLNGPRTIENLVDAITSLTAETVQASERNRLLERQLSASTTRIIKLRHVLTEVRQEASTDALTGVANRRALDAKLRRAMALSRNEGTPLSLLMIDVDSFKAFNDQHGHKAGDQVLRMVARLLTENVKGRDLVARYGGEEFAVLLTGADRAAAVRVATEIADKLGRKRLMGKASGLDLGRVTASVGVAQVRCGDDAAALLARADAAMYEAKRSGRNRVCAEAEAEADVC